MTLVRIITNGQKTQLTGRHWVGNILFYVVTDADGDFIVSEEVAQTLIEEFAWIKSRPQKEYKPVIKI